ncbi:alpha-amylase family glycosyl hydrolase [Candidatus Phycosocius spiralis]|uniref:Glucohydrolase n=1 Tax=Candidatus Phycosocius spiralis TaxID=2815099 RepID=A0ABQ4PUM0_9PROT|nr:alpha-amylase family glycosyl hydrolase [Candidatus Phycosocius spiralis]GIU66685.1 glucohydrolase [Candidatus Phycosocius spiralis]
MDAKATPIDRDWWKRRPVYQIYPRSFLDTNGDGVGDLVGITQGLTALKALGAGIVWLSPIFFSPMADNGYDMADYCRIDPRFGTMADFEALLAQAALLDLKIVLDIALNHTSIEHPWFVAAARDPTSPYRDFYHWREKPNNWHSIFGGPAWSQVPDGAYYLHLFDKTQADLNWDNPTVRQHIYEAMRFWLTKGVSGFRLDVVTVISKPAGLPDVADPSPGPLYKALAIGPNLHPWLREMRREVFDHYDCVAIGEGPGLNPVRAAQLVDPADPMLDMIYHFDFVDPPQRANQPWDRVWFKSVFSRWDQAIGPRGWNTCVLGNHDLRRLISRFGDQNVNDGQVAKALAAAYLLQRATPFIYQGDELGLGDTIITSFEDLNDVWAKTTYRLELEVGGTEAQALAKAAAMTRDHARTPYPWTPLGGFTTGTPWLKPTLNKGGVDLATQMADPNSVWSFYRFALKLREADPATWIFGAYEDIAPEHPDVFVFKRGEYGLVSINFGSQPYHLCDLDHNLLEGRRLLAAFGDVEGDQLGPWACCIFGRGN